LEGEKVLQHWPQAISVHSLGVFFQLLQLCLASYALLAGLLTQA